MKKDYIKKEDPVLDVDRLDIRQKTAHKDIKKMFNQVYIITQINFDLYQFFIILIIIYQTPPLYHSMILISNSLINKLTNIAFQSLQFIQVRQLFLNNHFSIMLKNRKSVLKHPSTKILYHDDHYIRLKLLGQGTFGKVYMVSDKIKKKIYALKQVVQNPKYKNRQLSIVSLMDHPNIIQMIDYFFKIVNGQCILHILMESMDSSLATLLKDQRKLKKPLDIHLRKIYAFQLFKGLYYLEMNKVCHRDLKPPNILINKNHQLKICDFGSAKIMENQQNNISYICSRYYRAPQLILNSTTYGCEIDMWSIGCVIIEFMTLEPIFPGDSSIEQLIEIIKILGTPTKNQLKLFIPEQNLDLKLPKVKGADLHNIFKRYNPEQLQLDLIRKILTYDVKKRISAYDAMMHPYFQDMITFKQVEQLPQLFQFSSLLTKQNKDKITKLNQLYQGYRNKNLKEKEVFADTASTVINNHHHQNDQI